MDSICPIKQYRGGGWQAKTMRHTCSHKVLSTRDSVFPWLVFGLGRLTCSAGFLVPRRIFDGGNRGTADEQAVKRMRPHSLRRDLLAVIVSVRFNTDDRHYSPPHLCHDLHHHLPPPKRACSTATISYDIPLHCLRRRRNDSSTRRPLDDITGPFSSNLVFLGKSRARPLVWGLARSRKIIRKKTVSS